MKNKNFIRFLGTAGARVVVAKQLRASGGIWISLNGTNLLIDPGPGSLVRCFASRSKLDPTTLDGIILSHKHLDHAADINVMMEAMTLGGKERHGTVLVPQDALSGDDPIIYKYVRPYVGEIVTMKENGKYRVGKVTISTPITHKHGVETYGLILKSQKQTIAYITDTNYFSELAQYYKADIVIVSVLSVQPNPFNHLSIEELKPVLAELQPRKTILTHFGMWMIEAKPWLVAQRLSRELKMDVVAAADGWSLKLPTCPRGKN
ncbi:MBL fold metallo-hydrolase [Candidatus Saganbacteria bacterium]|nr:MBL fold metallo-hydrolase [Candidatus Saganbacteria bacterium]